MYTTANGNILLSTKNDMPQGKEQLVQRPQLWAKLNQGLNRKLTFISGPAGSGKTTLLVQWLQEKKHSIIWVSLDQADSDPIRFFEYLTAGIERVYPDVAATIQNLFNASQPPTARAILSTLINELSSIRQIVLIVLDDYHLITSKEVHDSLTFMIEHLPNNMHIFITSRIEHTLPLNRLRAHGELVEIRTDELTFSAQEIDAYLNRIMGLSLSSQQLALLGKRTEGWIVGIKMAGLSLQNVKNTNDYIQDFAGTERFIVDYMLEEVLNQQSSKVREFLLKSSILDRLHSELCNQVLDIDNAATILKELEDGNLFIVPLDHFRGWYRYHHLFGEMLRNLLSQEYAEDTIAELQRKAGFWYEKRGHIEGAIQHALAGKDFRHASDLIQQHQQAFSTKGQMETLVKWYQSIPNHYWMEKPYISLSYAWALIETDRHNEVEKVLKNIELYIDEIFDAPEQRAFEAQIAILRSCVSLEFEAYQDTIRYCNEALEKLDSPDHTNACVALGNLGIVYESLGDATQAEAKLEEALRYSRRYGLPLNSVWLLSHLGRLRFNQGLLSHAEKCLLKAVHNAEINHINHIPALELANLYLARIRIEQCQYDEAKQFAEKAIQTGQMGRRYWLASAYATLADIEAVQGDMAQANQHMEHALELSVSVEPSQDKAYFFRYTDYLNWVQSHLWISNQRYQEAKEFIQEHKTIMQTKDLKRRPLLALIITNLHLWLNQPDEAMPLIKHCSKGNAEHSWPWEIHAWKLLTAEMYMQQERQSLAKQALQEAVNISTQFYNIILKLTRHSRPLLIELLQSSENTTLLERLAPEAATANNSSPFPKKPLPNAPVLSEREIEVLRQIQAGATNGEISDKLCIAVSTVKTHINNIYGKLEVRNRTEAVHQAQKWGLI